VHAAAVADALHRAGHDAWLYALDKDGRGFYRQLDAKLCLVPAQPAKAEGSVADLILQRREELASFLRARTPAHDIHHAEDCLVASALAELERERRIPFFVRTVHHIESFSDPFLSECQRQSIQRARACLAVSAKTEREVVEQFGVRPRRVPNGVDAERFARPDPARIEALRRRHAIGMGPVVLSFGGIEPRKNALRLLEAFLRILQTHPTAELVFAGGASIFDHPAYADEFRAILRRAGGIAEGAVKVLGVLPDDEVPALYHLASALAFVSVHEGFGLVVLEAMAAGLPVVCSNLAPMTEFVDARCGVLVEPLDPAEIAAGLSHALSTGKDAPMVRAARARAAEYAWPASADAHVSIYRALLDDIRESIEELKR
jgi:glycosyltransferase-like protein